RAGKAYGAYIMGRKVIVGGDSRTSHMMLKSAVVSGLLSQGCDVVDIGICPTPTIEMAIIGEKASGGVGITASHNPIEWNGLKFFNRKGEFLTQAQYDKFKTFLDSKDIPTGAWNEIGKIYIDYNWIEKHVDAVLALNLVKVSKLKRRKFKVVIDAVNGGGAVAAPILLKKLGCEVIEINCVPDGRFPHVPEPVPENLRMLSAKVREVKADIGFAVDPDADRLAIVSELGKPLGEEYTLALSADYVLSKNPGPMVINLSTSNLNRDVCTRHKCKLHYSKVGEANVVEMMRMKKAVIGGEGNGGVILPTLHYGRDSLVGMALILQHMADKKKKISELAGSIGPYAIMKSKGNIDSKFDVKLNRLQRELVDQEISTVDGVRVDFNYGWVHIRRSNTEPIYRLISEAGTKKEAQELIALIKEKL
ncbi:MAG: phosphoglucosamine mutase, partial [candidate division Zixibacteria bacterium]|nr:phosphoglucosamine mutase [candidate division Zixibacteria bacterium]NIR65444.1 phosphoglucosamine mutase [candidate division Zixibacteria bacterium]NIS15313.1 phosphoglucosamine mutase [candidate division Zixibacteria bacterium]NIS47135.1 phosphoglucosamine mutase [candidate division Zixibacteria bacterium]NIT51836.1 phosphoglucosamine mutase [candidate division Zixibacteria bacterium]